MPDHNDLPTTDDLLKQAAMIRGLERTVLMHPDDAANIPRRRIAGIKIVTSPYCTPGTALVIPSAKEQREHGGFAP